MRRKASFLYEIFNGMFGSKVLSVFKYFLKMFFFLKKNKIIFFNDF
jgi:hypothetical protein